MSKLKPTDFDERRLRWLGQFLSLARQNLRYSYRDLGKITGVSPSQILRMESGEFDYSISKFLLIAEALGLSVGIILEAAMFRDIPRKELSGFDSGPIEDFIRRLPRIEKPASEEWLLIQHEDDVSLIRHIVQALAEVVVSLTLSTAPQAMCFYFNSPFKLIGPKIEQYAHVHCLGFERHYERVATIKALLENPYLKLRAIGILDDAILVKYLEWCRADKGNLWRTMITCSWGTGHICRSEAGKNESESKTLLDISDVKPESVGVKAKTSSLPELFDQIRELIKGHGQKAALAREMKVSRQAVNNWLSGDAKPSAETTLELINWVGKQKRQK